MFSTYGSTLFWILHRPDWNLIQVHFWLVYSSLWSAHLLTRLVYYQATGIAQSLCQIVKHGSWSNLGNSFAKLYRFTSFYDESLAGPQGTLARKFGVKLAGRLALLLLPPPRRRKRKSKLPWDNVQVGVCC
jgi:hypothetical protein